MQRIAAENLLRVKARPDVQEKLRVYQRSDRNPILRREIRQKAQATLRARGWKNILNGGNGTPLPKAQRILSLLLGWEVEFVVPTGQRVLGGRPTCYKIDVAEPVLKIAIEVDGVTHLSKKVQMADQQKEKFLRGLGWRTMRFTNQEIMNHPESVLQAVMKVIQSIT